MGRLTAAELVRKLGGNLGLRLVTPGIESGAEIAHSDTFRPGLLLAGFSSGFLEDRVQMLGEPELAYLESLPPPDRRAALERLCVASVPCIVVAGGQPAPHELPELASARGIPVYLSDADPSRLARELASYLDECLAPVLPIHGTLVDVYGVGLLFTGKSGIGKSECALDLVAGGHRLVADDVVHVMRTPQGHLVGSGGEVVGHHMEIRGVGIIDVRAMFGVRAIRQRKRVEVEVKLTAWSDVEDYDRLGLDQEKTEILGVAIPVVTLPLVPGKNITVISEVIALNHLLRLQGIHTAREFAERLKSLAEQRAPAEWDERSDDE